MLRLILAFSISNFTYDSYFHLRQVEHITSHGLPLYDDPLSYGGRTLIFLPAFHYLSASLDLFLPLDLVAKLLPNILLSLIPFLIFIIAKQITKKNNPSLFAAFISAFIPILFQTNSFTPLSLFLPLSLLAIYSLMKIREKKFNYIYIISILILSLTSAATALLIIGTLFYLFLSKLEEKRTDKAELELALFSLFLFIWTQFLFFKRTLITEGPSFIWQNVPPQIMNQYFPNISILNSLILIGVIPFLIGLYTIYRSLFEQKNKNVFLLLGLAISTAFLAIINFVEFRLALMFFGLILAIFFAQAYTSFTPYLQKTHFTKIKRWTTVLPIIILILFIITSIIPSFTYALQQQTPSDEDLKAFTWIKENTNPQATIITSLSEGHLLAYTSQRKNFMDTQFSLIKDIDERFSHLNSFFSTSYQTQAISLFDRYNLHYLLVSPQSKSIYNLELPPYIDQRCFELLYSNTVHIYKVRCQLRPTKP